MKNFDDFLTVFIEMWDEGRGMRDYGYREKEQPND